MGVDVGSCILDAVVLCNYFMLVCRGLTAKLQAGCYMVLNAVNQDELIAGELRFNSTASSEHNQSQVLDCRKMFSDK